MPLATGKLSICTAKTKAADEPGQRHLPLVERLPAPGAGDSPTPPAATHPGADRGLGRR